jgi:hypothetical protein
MTSPLSVPAEVSIALAADPEKSSAAGSVSGTRIFAKMSILRPWRGWSRVYVLAKFFLKTLGNRVE